MRKYLINETQNQKLLKDGFVILTDVHVSIIDELEKLFKSYVGAYNSDGLQLTLKGDDSQQKEDIHLQTYNVVSNYINSVFIQFKPAFSGFINKKPNSVNVAGVHRDPSLTDETNFPTLLFWCPLVDTNENNGAIAVIPKSHKIFVGYKGLGKGKYDFSKHENEIQNEFGEIFFLNRGQAIVINTALLHFSEENKTEKDRPVYSCFLVPQESDILCYHHNKELNTLDVYRADEEAVRNYYSKYIAMNELPFPLIERHEFHEPAAITFADFKKEYKKILQKNVFKSFIDELRNFAA